MLEITLCLFVMHVSSKIIYLWCVSAEIITCLFMAHVGHGFKFCLQHGYLCACLARAQVILIAVTPSPLPQLQISSIG